MSSFHREWISWTVPPVSDPSTSPVRYEVSSKHCIKATESYRTSVLIDQCNQHLQTFP